MDQVFSLLLIWQGIQVGCCHLGRLQLMKELDQLLDKLGILLKTGINLELFIRHLRKHLKKEHAKTDIIKRLLLMTFIECKIACHLSKARNGDGKRSLLVYELQDFALLLKR